MADSIFGMSEKAIQVCEDRATLLSSNIVNSSTPRYKARDIDFRQVMSENQQSVSSPALAVTEKGHIAASQDGVSESVMYRVPMQKSMDGNTVDEDIERKNFIENALRYQVNLTFVQNKSDELLHAIKG
jgi:flagellar basal-body rod protein FlgB